MKILIACEFSGTVREAFRLRGHDTWSCDLLPSELPRNHIQDDVLKHLDEGWDLMIAHPPCTYLSSAGLHWNHKRPEREQKTIEAFYFFMDFVKASWIPKICIENPTGYVNTHYRKPDQIIEPYQYGEPFIKRTCLWLKGLNKLEPTNIITPTHYYIDSGSNYRKGGKLLIGKCHRNPHERSRTFQGIAKAMAEQWG